MDELLPVFVDGCLTDGIFAVFCVDGFTETKVFVLGGVHVFVLVLKCGYCCVFFPL